jgi:hypothetical protein
MNSKELETRISALEKAVAELKAKEAKSDPWQKIIGHFKNDPIFEEIVRLGREYRLSDHPDRKKKKPRKS